MKTTESSKLTSTKLAEHIECDEIRKVKGNYKFLQGFFYTGGYTAKKFAQNITSQLEGLVEQGTITFFYLIDSGEKWATFRGRASLSQSSHWYAIFHVE
jgi:hypothetical protein